MTVSFRTVAAFAISIALSVPALAQVSRYDAKPMQFPDASKVPANMLYPGDGSAFDMLARFI